MKGDEPGTGNAKILVLRLRLIRSLHDFILAILMCQSKKRFIEAVFMRDHRPGPRALVTGGGASQRAEGQRRCMPLPPCEPAGDGGRAGRTAHTLAELNPSPAPPPSRVKESTISSNGYGPREDFVHSQLLLGDAT
jgi:hypothetical protein